MWYKQSTHATSHLQVVAVGAESDDTPRGVPYAKVSEVSPSSANVGGRVVRSDGVVVEEKPRESLLAATMSGVRHALTLEWEAIKALFIRRDGSKRGMLIASCLAGALVGLTEKQEQCR